jgi:hypothetical protein
MPAQVSVDKKNYFYHHAEWYDINQDGRMVRAVRILVTCYFPRTNIQRHDTT